MKKQAVRNSPRLGRLPTLGKISSRSPKNIKKKKSKRMLAQSLSPLRKAPAPDTDTELKKKLRRISSRLLQQEFVDNKTEIYESESRSKGGEGCTCSSS